jgi:hypothetical protein
MPVPNEGRFALVIAAGLGTVSVAALLLGEAAISILSGLITVPVALYAALATRGIGTMVALAAALAGVAVIGLWVFIFVSAIQGSSAPAALAIIGRDSLRKNAAVAD